MAKRKTITFGQLKKGMLANIDRDDSLWRITKVVPWNDRGSKGVSIDAKLHQAGKVPPITTKFEDFTAGADEPIEVVG